MILENYDITKVERDGYLEVPEVIGCCDSCHEDIEEGCEMYEYDGDIYCEECFDDFLQDLKKECLIKY